MNRVRRGAWAALLMMAAVQGWVYRHVVSPDGVAYLDLSDAIVSGRLADLVNGYWSPLYPAMVGLVRLVVSPTPLASPYWELVLLHAVSFLGFVVSLAAFEWFLRALDESAAHWGEAGRPFASPRGLAVAYLLFAVTSLGMISVAGTVPDFFLAAAVLAACACALRLRSAPGDRRAATRLGLALAAGALAKAIAFSLAVVILVSLALTIWKRGGRAAVVRASAIFAVVSLPWVLAVSFALGRPSVGRTGSLNYAWYVNDQQPPNTGALPASAAPRDSLPLSGLGVLPAASGTNPMWYDPARWHRDVRPRFSVAQQWARLSWSLRYYVFIGAPILLALVAIGVGASRRDAMITARRGSVVLLPCLAAFAAYGLVYTASRHIAVFLLAACLTLAAAFPTTAAIHPARFSAAFAATLVAIEALAPTPLRSMITVAYGMAMFLIGWVALAGRPAVVRWMGALAAVLLVWVLALLPPLVARSAPFALGLALWAALWAALSRHRHSASADSHATGVRRAFAIAAVVACAVPGFGFGVVAARRWMAAPRSELHPEWASAQRLIREGVPAGSRIAILGNPESSGWARLARYQIVAVVPEDRVEAFLALTEEERARVMAVFARAGATRLVRSPAR